MQRLTRRDPDGAANFADADFESVCAELTPTNREKVRAIVDKLADWEDGKEYAESVLNEGGRLTTVDKDGNAELVNEDSLPQFYLIKRIGDAFEKLRAYEDAEEQGQLVTLPVQIGQKVYRHRYTGKGDNRCVVEWTVSAIAFLDGQKVDITFRRGQDEFFHCEYGGANWRVTYMTREEAEAALKGGGI